MVVVVQVSPILNREEGGGLVDPERESTPSMHVDTLSGPNLAHSCCYACVCMSRASQLTARGNMTYIQQVHSMMPTKNDDTNVCVGSAPPPSGDKTQ
jgi:hypothetical protein